MMLPCPCGQTLRTNEAMAGKRVRCPACQATLVVPDLSSGVTAPEHPAPDETWHATMEVTGQTWHFESCNAFYRREPFLRAGGFDEQLGHFAEDTIAGWAMLRAGWEPR